MAAQLNAGLPAIPVYQQPIPQTQLALTNNNIPLPQPLITPPVINYTLINLNQFETIKNDLRCYQTGSLGDSVIVKFVNGNELICATPLLSTMFGVKPYQGIPGASVTCCFNLPPNDTAHAEIASFDFKFAVHIVRDCGVFPSIGQKCIKDGIFDVQLFYDFCYIPCIKEKVSTKDSNKKFFNFTCDCPYSSGEKTSLLLKVYDNNNKEIPYRLPIDKFKAMCVIQPYSVRNKEGKITIRYKLCQIKKEISNDVVTANPLL